MNSLPILEGMTLAGILFITGLVGILIRRNLIFVLLGIEIMLNAAGLAFIIAGARWGQADGQVMFLFILAMAAVEVSIGLALVLRQHDRYTTLDVETMNNMRG